jgi:linoleoyl-CoA desaturase
MHSLSELYQDLKVRGLTGRTPGRVLAELAFHLGSTAAGIGLFLLADHMALRAFGLLAMTAGLLGVSTNSHTSSHNATSKKLWVNKALTFFGFTIVLGVPSTYWWNKHITVHHPTPNVVGLDDDVDLLPWFALTQEEFESGGPLRRLWHRYQWLAVPLAIGINAFNMAMTGYRYLFGALLDGERRRRVHWVDLGMCGIHLLVWFGLPALWFPVTHVLGFYVLRNVLFGYAMFAGFAPAHFPADARFLASGGESDRTAYRKRHDFILLQTVTTVNFRTGWYGRMLCSGVDYQIEHHLFPGISHAYYPQVSPLLREFCERNGYPYRTLGWGEAIWKSLLAFKHPHPVEPELERLRERVAREGADMAVAGA